MENCFPRMICLRQKFPTQRPLDIAGTIEKEFDLKEIASGISLGSKVAVAVGSRGVANLAQIVFEVIKNLKRAGAHPFIVPAMGSHGGATAQGQVLILNGYGVSEAAMGVPIESSMEVELLGNAESGIPVYFSRAALSADSIVVVNRVKPHTDFFGDLGSGILKMTAIGLAKHTGAAACHFVAARLGHERVIRNVSRFLVGSVPFLCGVAIIENQFHETHDLVVLKRGDVEQMEMKLLAQAKSLMPRLPFDDIDLLIVDWMGKNVSGAGMDPNVIGREVQGYSTSLIERQKVSPRIQRIVVCNLTPETHGNGIGIGMADFAASRIVRSLDTRSTYVNALTAVTPQTAKIPIHFDTDREMITAACASLCIDDVKSLRVLRISDTLRLESLDASEAFEEEVKSRQDLEIVREARDIEFDSSGNLSPLQAPV
ncbi:MAG: lactate racemase domain-containing protein [Candidatus Acidiferrales bacterium]